MLKIFTFTLTLLFTSTALAAENGVIYDFKGPVLINGKLANKHSLITFGDDIITGSRGRISLRLAGNVYRLGNRSHLKLPKTEKNFTLNFLFGALTAVFRHDTTKTIRTRTAVLGVRGTGLHIIENNEQTYLCTCYGDIDFKDNLNQENVTHIHGEYHNATTFSHQSREFQTHQPMQGHQTEDLFELEALATRTPPQTFASENKLKNVSDTANN